MMEVKDRGQGCWWQLWGWGKKVVGGRNVEGVVRRKNCVREEHRGVNNRKIKSMEFMVDILE